jgi:uncharacterized membrane protein YccC
MTDLSKVLREEAAHCRRLAELATEHTIRQDLMEMAARLQAIADEIDEPYQRRHSRGRRTSLGR